MTDLLKKVKSIDPNVKLVQNTFIFIFDKILNSDPCSYYNKDVYNETLELLEDLYENFSNKLNIDESIFNYFLMGYNSYVQTTDVISDVKLFNISSELKTRLYRLPTYTSLVESFLSNFLRVIANLIGQSCDKDYASQNKLGSLIDIVKKHNFNQIAYNTNVNIRNAINHGKVIVRTSQNDNELIFHYEEKRTSRTLTMKMYEFDKMLDDIYDMASGVLLALSSFFNNHISLLNIDKSKKEYIAFSLHALELSIPKTQCINISNVECVNQLNIEMKVENTERGYLASLAIMISLLIYEKYNDYEQYMISFSNPRMITGWIRFKKQEIQDMYDKKKSFNVVVEEVIERKDFMFFDASTEEIDLNEIKYFCFPNYNGKDFKINKIEDASLPGRKRFKAHLFINEETDKLKILDIFYQAIEWLKSIKNPPSPSWHKNMEICLLIHYILMFIEKTVEKVKKCLLTMKTLYVLLIIMRMGLQHSNMAVFL